MDGITRCMPSECLSNPDCPSGLCLTSSGGCYPHYYTSNNCATDGDYCRSNESCDTNQENVWWSNCEYNAQKGRFGCREYRQVSQDGGCRSTGKHE